MITFKLISRVASGLPLVILAACGGGYGGGSASASPPTLTLAVQPNSVPLGQSATLNWTATAGATCVASGGWTGAQAATGMQTVTPAATGGITYTLTCRTSVGGGYGGGSPDVAKSATLTVTAANVYSKASLVSDLADALTLDANLMNPWGIAFGPNTSAWVTNNHTGNATVYDGNGRAKLVGNPPVVNMMPSAGGIAFDPTGVVFNPTPVFAVTKSGRSMPAVFIFVGEGGTVGGWSPTVDARNVLVTYTDDGGAAYKGVALANDGTTDFLYATDFHNAKVDVFNGAFSKIPTSATQFAFADPHLPAGYAPFGIQALTTGSDSASQLYVSYAKQATPGAPDHVAGAGLGIIDVYDTSGRFIRTLVPSGGALNAPWGMALAPSDFGAFSNALLVGNVGDGKINGYDPATGAHIGTLSDANGAALELPGLWGIAFGNGVNVQPHNTLFYAAGSNHEADGVYGRIDLGATPPVLNEPPAVSLTAPNTGNVSGTVTVAATAESNLAILQLEFFAAGTRIGVVTTAPYTMQWDTTAVANGDVILTAKASDVDGNARVSAPVTVTVANGIVPTTLSRLQGLVFTPRCSGCHNGSNPPGGDLPGSQNLTSGNAFASLVNIPSKEIPGLLRIKPGDPALSYLVQKIEGASGIQGARMPLGGPFLDQATIDQVKSWITAGAVNN
jgi:uncharacterized protein (TIGR03118 family)